jgi:type IV secretion system protein TrbI
MIAQVNQNVFDSATGRYLLIPQGSRLFGRYDAGVTYGQERVLIVWTDLTFPDGSTLHLGGMAGSDQAGYGGFADRIDNHELRTYGSAILLSLVGAASEYAIATARNPGVGGVSLTLQQAGVENVSSTFGNVVRQSFQKNINVQPTIEVRPGYRFNVIVEKDIVFPPYGP